MMNNSILKPDVRTIYLKNKAKERVTYLQIPPDIDTRTLTKDVKEGAVQFKELLDELKKDEQSQYFMIHAENLEMGYMAVMYHAACCNAFRIDYDNEDETEYSEKPEFEWFQVLDNEEEYNDDMAIWKESGIKIPVIDCVDVRRNLCDQPEDYFFNSFSMQQNNMGVNERPYWMDCREEAVCIVCNTDGFGCMIDEETVRNLDYFRNNKRIYIIFIGEIDKRNEQIDENDFMFSIGMDNLAVKNEIILTFLADEVRVKLEEEQEKKYYKYLFRKCLHKNDVKVAKGFSYEKVINLIMSMKKNEICNLIDKIIKYAIKEKGKKGGNVLVTEDFRFIDKFMRTSDRKKDKKEKGAREKLMNQLIGMDEVKEQVLDVVNVMKYSKMREKLGIAASEYHNVHVMLGAPGTAKTTVAKLMGQIMLEEKLLPDNRFICVNGAELKGMYVGHSAPKTKALFDNHDVIVIDEAYSLVDDAGVSDSFSREAIAQLIIELENHATDKLVIFAGYGGTNVSEKNNKMKDFINANPGIKSRITSTFIFESYTSDEMIKIFRRLAALQHFHVESEADTLLSEFFEERIQDDNFGNGREARSLLETCILYAAKRVMEKQKPEKSEFKKITVEDVDRAIEKTKKSYQQQYGRAQKLIGFTA